MDTRVIQSHFFILRTEKHSLTQFEQPALAVGVKERVREVIAVVFRYLEGLILNALIKVLQECLNWVVLQNKTLYLQLKI